MGDNIVVSALDQICFERGELIEKLKERLERAEKVCRAADKVIDNVSEFGTIIPEYFDALLTAVDNWNILENKSLNKQTADGEFLSTDHEISLDRSVRVINKEIQWCYQHIDSNALAANYQHRFIRGLEQAKYLLIEMAKHEALDDLYTKQAASQQASDDDIRRPEEAQNGTDDTI